MSHSGGDDKSVKLGCFQIPLHDCNPGRWDLLKQRIISINRAGLSNRLLNNIAKSPEPIRYTVPGSGTGVGVDEAIIISSP